MRQDQVYWTSCQGTSRRRFVFCLLRGITSIVRYEFDTHILVPHYHTAILSQAGVSTKNLHRPTHQEIEIRDFCERLQRLESNTPIVHHQAAAAFPSTNNNNSVVAQAYLLEQAARQVEARRQQQEAQEAFLKEAALVRAQQQQAQREAEALLQVQQAAQENPTLSQILVALQNRNREEELIAQELQRIKQEEMLRQQQQMVQEANAQARIQELLLMQANNNNTRVAENGGDGNVPVTALLRAALENNQGGALAAQLRQFI